MFARLHLSLLHVFQRLPRRVRRQVVRTVAPTFSVGAICFIERDGGDLLLVRLAYREHWGVPGGLLRRGEDAADGARREVFEEVGLAVELVGEPAVVVDPDPRRVDVVYRARPVTGTDVGAVQPCSPEIVEVRWFPRDQLPELQPESVGALLALERASIVHVRAADGS